MILLYIWLLFAAFAVRAMAGYDRRDVTPKTEYKYITVKPPWLAKLLLDEHCFPTSRRRRLKQDFPRMSYSGIFLYIMLAFVTVLQIALSLLPDVPIAPFFIGSDEVTKDRFLAYVDTRNELIMTVLLFLFIAFLIGYAMAPSFKKDLKTEKTWVRISVLLLAVILYGVLLGGSVLFVLEAVQALCG